VIDVVEININVPQKDLAELLANPRNCLKWMLDLKSFEPVSGEEGLPGSTYRLVAKDRDMVFLATVVERNLPSLLKLNVKGSGIDIVITSRMVALSPTKTKLISEKNFTFEGMNNAEVRTPTQDAIQIAHSRHIKEFKSFAERYFYEQGH